MENFLLVYNILLTIFLTMLLTGFFALYHIKKSKIYVFLSVLFLLLIIDNSLIYLSEFSTSFSSLYENTDLIYIAIYVTFIGIILFARLASSQLYQDRISKNEIIFLCFIILIEIILSYVLSFAISEFIIYSSLYMGVAYITLRSWIVNEKRPNDFPQSFFSYTNLIVLAVIVVSIGGIVESAFYLSSYNELIEESIVSLEYRNIAFDIIKLIAVIIGFIYLLRHFNDIQNSRKLQNKSKQDKVDDFCIKHALTMRQKDIIMLIVEGNSNKEIGSKLHITEGTVKTHIYTIFRKVNISSRNQLITMIMHG